MSPRRPTTLFLCLISAGLLVAPGAVAAPPRVVISTIAASPTSAVPGLPGVSFTMLYRPFRSPSGVRFIMRCATTGPTTSNEVLLSGSLAAGQVALGVAARKGAPATFAPDPAEVIGPLDTVCRVLDDGRFAFGVNTDGGASASDEYTVLFDGQQFVAVAREDDPAPGMPGYTYGGSMRSTNITVDGSVGFLAVDLRQGDGTLPDAHLFADFPLATTSTTVPLGQLDGESAPWTTFDNDRLFLDASGESWLQSGTLFSGARVVTIGNSVVLQNGFPPPGYPALQGVVSVLQAFMETDGTWLARGTNADSLDWVIRNGLVAAASGTPILPSTTEAWQRSVPHTFRFQAVNTRGDLVIAGNTDAPNTAADDVVVLAGSTVVLREGQGVDVNGNGQLDDNAIISAFRDDSAFITESRRLFCLVGLRTTGGATLGDALIEVTIPAVCGSADFDGDGDTGTDSDIEAFFACLGGDCCDTCISSDFDGDGDAGTDADIEAFFRVLSGGSC